MSVRAGITQSITLFALGAILTLALLVALVGGGYRRDSYAIAASVSPVNPASLKIAITPLGRMNAGCNASTCHGAPREEKSLMWRSSAVIFAENDPHAFAYEALYTPRSRAIVSKLLGEEIDSSAYQSAVQKHCAACHAGEFADDHTTSASLARQTGLSCEACHGPASAWREAHLASDWKTQDRTALGFRDLKQPRVLAATCTACHIGSDDAPEGMERRVTHDLLAAGHPRLDFDTAAWLRRLPAHSIWYEPTQLDFGLKQFDLWREGLLAVDRAARSDKTTDLDFARFDCQACHHALSDPSRIANSSGKLQPREASRLAPAVEHIDHPDNFISFLESTRSTLRTSEQIIAWYYAAETANTTVGNDVTEELAELRRAIEASYEVEPHRYALPSLPGDAAIEQAIDRLLERLRKQAGNKS